MRHLFAIDDLQCIHRFIITRLLKKRDHPGRDIQTSGLQDHRNHGKPADQIVTRVKGFDCGAKEDIVAMTIIYPIDFLPAT